MATLSRRLLAVTAVLATAGAAVVLGSSAAGAATGSWFAARSVCAQPTDPSTIRCFAQKLVPAPAGSTGAFRAARVGHGPTGGYSPTDLAKAYGYNRTTRVKQTVALVDWYDDPYVLADLNHFDSHYTLPRETSTSFRKVNQAGHAAPLPKRSADAAGEIALDVQAVRAVCASCRILLVEANSPSSANLAAAENTAARLGATEISNSWGGPEDKHDFALLEPALYHPGVVITASTGDDGWRGWGTGDGAASFPSTSPRVVAVGGTRLTVNANGTRKVETVWSDEDGATGGGCSTLDKPFGWQSHTPGYAALGCKGYRLAADIAALADPATGFDVYDRYGTATMAGSGCHTSAPSNACWARTGGTSLASPLIAAMYALASGSGGSAYPAASLYVNRSRSASSVYDVTHGGNGACSAIAPYSAAGFSATNCAAHAQQLDGAENNNPNDYFGEWSDCSIRSYGQLSDSDLAAIRTSPQCNATTGFDGPTGLGTPHGLGVFRDTSPSAAVSAARVQRRGAAHTFAAALKPVVSGAAITSVAWNFGDRHTVTGTATKVRHAYSRTGHYTVTMTAIDQRYQRVVRHLSVTVK